ncbi:MAG: hypothetical protein H0V79_00005 [Actinobacteria bacterium]|nr:hypothetical protein [Actinomycetota bacterium]
MRTRIAVAAVGCLVWAALGAAQASASHSWGNYHWARTSNPFTVPLGDNLSSDWKSRLGVASTDWTASSVLDSPVVAGAARKRCSANNGRIEVCNGSYGFNGWLGLAQIWTSGGHIVKATAKMNDSYLSSVTYTNTNKQHVLCQEVGHGYGLGHQDESGADLNTCMDYADALDNPSPNAHDYQQLETIYNSHLDATSTVTSTTATSGVVVHRRDGLRSSHIVEDLGRGFRLHTFVFHAVPGF